ncbi:transglycosylase family protein [Nakamurella flavida]|uniref:Transglycosylase family protein n=1 Tax=Nakamurella flavida TaxID=363630 RepID=A0A938YKH0_9ACTN|nr:transglycosylase family protein [Nakamurella flavida]MBM9476358.1 transglycosylase family protein [Nakamurella flavida]MDP9779542.1 hypothetical protein [Nakamurella flavida]
MTAERTTAPGGVSAPPGRRRVRPSAVVALLAVAVSLAAVLVGGGSASADPSATDWQRLRQCESGNNYTANTGNGYYGAYQFDASTWRSVGGTGLPHQASAATQDALALKLWQQRGWSPWVCASILGLDGAGGGGGNNSAAAVGSLDSVSADGLSATVAGWVLDPTRTSAASQVHVYVSAPGVDPIGYPFTADVTRTDVNQVLGVTGRHGFSVQVPLRPGPNTVCAYAIGGSGNSHIGCRTLTAVGTPPVGSVDVVSATGLNAWVAGWAVDPASPGTSIPVHVYVNGTGYPFTADGSRPDVNAVLGISGRHGYAANVPLRRGTNTVCAYGIGSASSGNALIACRDVQSAEPPLGSLDGIQVSGSSARVFGWAFDPATSASTDVHIYVNGVGYAFRADEDRPDVNAAFRISGAHGYAETVPLGPGRNTVCAYGIGRPGNPSNLVIGCRDVQNGSVARSGVAVQEAPAEAAPSSPAPTSTAPTSTAPSAVAPVTPAPVPATSSRGTSTPTTPAPATGAPLTTAPATSAPATTAPASTTGAPTTTDGGSR